LLLGPDLSLRRQGLRLDLLPLQLLLSLCLYPLLLFLLADLTIILCLLLLQRRSFPFRLLLVRLIVSTVALRAGVRRKKRRDCPDRQQACC
jgi:hypothetical protein